MSTRLKALDGLRGIAILAVIINHVPLKIWSDSIPSFLSPFLNMFLAGGKIGVSILFLLTGFLMAWIYPSVSSPISFYARRYARLFPAFIVMVVSLSLIKLFSPPSIIIQLLLVVGVAFIARIIWNLCQQVPEKYKMGRFITYFWLVLQAGVALWYVYYLLKIPSPVFYQTWSTNLQLFITALVNATLTLPFGNYIGQVDGVYWSLITETLFYILYPILFLPLFHLVKNNPSPKIKTLTFFTTLPYCLGLFYASRYILGFNMMLPHLMIYFIAGVTLGLNLKYFQNKIQKFPKFFFHPISLFFLLFISFSGPLIYPLISNSLNYWLSMILVFPLTLIVAGLSMESNPWTKIMESKPLVFLGKYSYSLYLTHALCIQLSEKIITPSTVINGFILIMLSLTISIILSLILYHLIEAPYYSLPKSIGLKIQNSPTPKFLLPHPVLFCFSLFTFILLYFGYRPQVSFFTSVSSQKINQHLSLFPNETYVEITPQKPEKFTFKANSDRLGMITSHIKNMSSGLLPSTLKISLSDAQNRLISQSTFNPSEIDENHSFSFGFPQEINSKDKTYHLTYELIPSNSTSIVRLITTESNFNLVYFPDKKELISHPDKLFSWFIGKTLEPTQNPQFYFALINFLPLILMLWLSLRSSLSLHPNRTLRQ